MTIYLLRHGRTDWNEQHRIQGREDIPLNALGREQATIAAETFRRLDINEIWASPLSRAFETASIVAAACGIREVQRHEGLVERDFGRFGGMPFEEFTSFGTEEGAEPFEHLQQRALETLDDIASRSRGERVLIVGHGACIDSILRHYKGIPFEGILSIKLKNCSISKFERSLDGRLSLVWENRAANEVADNR